MGASLLVFANKTDVKGCMADDEIHEVGDRHRATERTADGSRACNSMQSRHTSGPSFGAAQSQEIDYEKAWNGWCKTREIDSSCTDGYIR